MMTKIFRVVLIIAAISFIATAMMFLLPHNQFRTLAQMTGETPYGGMRSFTLTCTCTGNSLLYIMDYRTNMLLMLLYQPGASKLYSYYDIYGRYLLGTYSSAAGNSCQIYVGEDCVEIFNNGQMGNMPGTGTSN